MRAGPMIRSARSPGSRSSSRGPATRTGRALPCSVTRYVRRRGEPLDMQWCIWYTIRMEIVVPGRQRPYLEGESLDVSAPLVFTLGEVLGGSECAELIARCEPLGFAPAPITTAAGFVMRPDVRNNE